MVSTPFERRHVAVDGDAAADQRAEPSVAVQHEVSFAWNGLHLAGTLHVPAGAGRHAVVMMMQGSGASDRNSFGYFEPIRDAFVDRGLAVYTFDKPGCGSSTGDWHDYALMARAEQVEAAIDALGDDPRLDPARLGVFGHSQGGWMAQILAARDLDLAFAIATSGPTIGVADQDRHAAEQQLRAAGHRPEVIAAALAVMTRTQNAARDDVDYATLVDTVLGPSADQPWFDAVEVSDAAQWALTKSFVREAYIPTETLPLVRCPFLAVYGGRDSLLPAWECSVEAGRALGTAPGRDAAVVVFPKGDHRLRHPNGEFVDGYLDLVSSWAARSCGIEPG